MITRTVVLNLVAVCTQQHYSLTLCEAPFSLHFPGCPSWNAELHPFTAVEFSSSDHVRGINAARAKDRELLCNGIHQSHFICLDPNKQHTFPVNPVCYQMFDWVKMLFYRFVFLLQEVVFSEILVLPPNQSSKRLLYYY